MGLSKEEYKRIKEDMEIAWHNKTNIDCTLSSIVASVDVLASKVRELTLEIEKLKERTID